MYLQNCKRLVFNHFSLSFKTDITVPDEVLPFNAYFQLVSGNRIYYMESYN